MYNVVVTYVLGIRAIYLCKKYVGMVLLWKLIGIILEMYLECRKDFCSKCISWENRLAVFHTCTDEQLIPPNKA